MGRMITQHDCAPQDRRQHDFSGESNHRNDGFCCALRHRIQLLAVYARSAQYAADGMALSLATKMNTADRIGVINELQEASRELIFDSRQICAQSSEAKLQELPVLCDQLLESARSGHGLVERERQNQILLIGKELQESIVAYNHERDKGSEFSFFGMRMFEPEILQVDLGRIAKINCNVKALEAIPELPGSIVTSDTLTRRAIYTSAILMPSCPLQTQIWTLISLPCLRTLVKRLLLRVIPMPTFSCPMEQYLLMGRSEPLQSNKFRARSKYTTVWMSFCLGTSQKLYPYS